MNTQFNPESALRLGVEVLNQEALAIQAVKNRLANTPDFVNAVELILSCSGRLVISGVGKSGHIGRKLAATFASTGTPSFFVHAAEASHGDLGMITKNDVVIGISYSGETQELLSIIPSLKREGTPIIAMTGNLNSNLARHADIHLDCSVEREACPLNLAPTSSTTVTLALGDALAIACLSAKGFGEADFAKSHPGGALGRRLLLHIADIMRSAHDVPKVTDDVTVLEAVQEITRKHIGMTAIVDHQNRVVGIFTEGDLRRLIERLGDIRHIKIADVMTRHPHTIKATELAAVGAKELSQYQCNQLLVVDDDFKLIGALHMHDLMQAKVI